MRSIRARLEDLEERVADSPLAATDGEDPREQLRAKLDEQAERMGPIPPAERPDSKEVIAELNARLDVLAGGGGGR